MENLNQKDLKLETVNIGAVEVFSTGIWKGKEYNENDLDEMTDNFNNKVAEPYLTIDHSDKATSQFKDALKALALGYVEKLERKGNKLLAWFKQVPKTIAELIEVGALKKKSIEFYSKFIANGKLYKNVLEGITFHGANGLPEVNTLSDFLNLYKSNLQVMVKNKVDIISLKNTDREVKKPMDGKIELKNDEYNEMLKTIAQVKTTQDTNKSLNENMETMKKESIEVKDENEKLKLKMKGIEDKAKEGLNKEADVYISKKVNDGIIKAPFKDRYVAEYVTYKANDNLFKSFIADIESRGQTITLDPTKTSTTLTENFKYDPDKIDFKVGSTINYEELEANIQAIMKAKNLSWVDASIECNAMTAEEIGKEEVAK